MFDHDPIEIVIRRHLKRVYVTAVDFAQNVLAIGATSDLSGLTQRALNVVGEPSRMIFRIVGWHEHVPLRHRKFRWHVDRRHAHAVSIGVIPHDLVDAITGIKSDDCQRGSS